MKREPIERGAARSLSPEASGVKEKTRSAGTAVGGAACKSASPLNGLSEDRQQFEAFMARHVAQLLDFAKPYIGRLVPEQREQFLAFALEQAWEKRAELKPRKNAYAETTVDLLRWWEDHCLRPAALSKRQWSLRTWDRQIQLVPGHRLGKERS